MSLGVGLKKRNDASQKAKMDELRDNIIIILALTALMTYQTLNSMFSRMYQLTDNARALELVAGCELWGIYPPSQPFRTLVLACPGVDAIRLWPLPVEQPWAEDR
jgi:hypothetical protein